MADTAPTLAQVRELRFLLGARTIHGLVESTRTGAGGYVRIFTIQPHATDPITYELTKLVIEVCGFKAREHSGNTWIFIPGGNFDRLEHVAEIIAIKLGLLKTPPTKRL